MQKSGIEFSDYSWTPATGCNFGCSYCYARRMAERFSRNVRINMASPLCKGDKTARLFELDEMFKSRDDNRTLAFPFGFYPTLHRYRLGANAKPCKVTAPSIFFVCSTGDLFGPWVPQGWIDEVMATCELAPHHQYLFLTKNPARYNEPQTFRHLDHLNYWLGTTITCNADLPRASDLLFKVWPYVEANNFLSIEPLHERLDTDKLRDAMELANWVIVGAETMNSRTVMSKAPAGFWLREIVNVCHNAGVPVFLKDNLEPIWGEPLIQEFPAGLQPQAKPLPKHRVRVESVRDEKYCMDCGECVQGRPATRLGGRKYMCDPCMERAVQDGRA